MKKLIEELVAERNFHHAEVLKFEQAIKGLRKICKHKHPNGESALKFTGNDHNYHYYKCEICGHTHSE